MTGIFGKSLVRAFEEPRPARRAALAMIRALGRGSYDFRVRIGAVARPPYTYCVYHAASLASRLGVSRISVVEFGVAAGRGLLNLEHHAREASRRFSVGIEVYGFDTGAGLPEPIDYRDLPYHWRKGFFRMDEERLRASLREAKLVLGDLSATAPTVFHGHKPAPIGAIAYDLDFYSSTVTALKMLEAGDGNYLPRVYCYLDDIIGSEVELYNDFSGVRLAVDEFNREHPSIKMSPAYHFLSRPLPEPWHHQIRICHFLKHPRYNDFVSESDQEEQVSLA